MEEESAHEGEISHSLYSLLRACQRGQRFAVVGSHDDIDESITPFLNKLYVNDTPEDEILNDFFVDSYEDDGKLLIISGSAGDGKSALLSKGYLAAKAAGNSAVEKSRINMDATAADRKHQRYEERLLDFFENVLPDAAASDGPRSGLAINYGLAVDFFQQHDFTTSAENLEMVWEALKESRKRTDGIYRDNSLIVINLSQRKLYSTHPNSLGDGLLRKMIDRFGIDNESQSPIYAAFQQENEYCPAGEQCPLHYNVEQFGSPDLRGRVAEVIAGWNIITGSYFNPRGILDLIASILLPDVPADRLDRDTECPIGAAIEDGTITPSVDHLLWNRLFDVLADGNSRLANRVDPLSQSSIELDTKVLGWYGQRDELVSQLTSPPGISEADTIQLIKTIFRYHYLTGSEEIRGLLESDSFIQYSSALTILKYDSPSDESELGDRTGELFRTVRNSLRGWSGRQRNSQEIEFVDAQRSPAYRFLSRWGDPKVLPEPSESETRKQTVPGRISLQLDTPAGSDELIRIPLTYELYLLMEQINHGYTPSAVDIEHSEAVTQIKSKFSDLTRKRDYVKVINRSNSREFTIQQQEYGKPTVEREGSW